MHLVNHICGSPQLYEVAVQYERLRPFMLAHGLVQEY